MLSAKQLLALSDDAFVYPKEREIPLVGVDALSLALQIITETPLPDRGKVIKRIVNAIKEFGYKVRTLPPRHFLRPYIPQEMQSDDGEIFTANPVVMAYRNLNPRLSEDEINMTANSIIKFCLNRIYCFRPLLNANLESFSDVFATDNEKLLWMGIIESHRVNPVIDSNPELQAIIGYLSFPELFREAMGYVKERYYLYHSSNQGIDPYVPIVEKLCSYLRTETNNDERKEKYITLKVPTVYNPVFVEQELGTGFSHRTDGDMRISDKNIRDDMRQVIDEYIGDIRRLKQLARVKMSKMTMFDSALFRQTNEPFTNLILMRELMKKGKIASYTVFKNDNGTDDFVFELKSGFYLLIAVLSIPEERKLQGAAIWLGEGPEGVSDILLGLMKNKWLKVPKATWQIFQYQLNTSNIDEQALITLEGLEVSKDGKIQFIRQFNNTSYMDEYDRIHKQGELFVKSKDIESLKLSLEEMFELIATIERNLILARKGDTDKVPNENDAVKARAMAKNDFRRWHGIITKSDKTYNFSKTYEPKADRTLFSMTTDTLKGIRRIFKVVMVG